MHLHDFEPQYARRLRVDGNITQHQMSKGFEDFAGYSIPHSIGGAAGSATGLPKVALRPLRLFLNLVHSIR